MSIQEKGGLGKDIQIQTQMGQAGTPNTLSYFQNFFEVPEEKKQQLFSTPAENRWDGSFNEGNVFDSMYGEAVQSFYADALNTQRLDGAQILKVYQKWKPLVARFVANVLHNSQINNHLNANLTWEPEGSSQAILRHLQVDTFANAEYEQTPGATGQFNIVPDEDQGDGATETATANEQAWIIIGYADFKSGRTYPYDIIQEDVNDSIGVRRPLYTNNAMRTKDGLSVLERYRGPLPVQPGETLDIDIGVKADFTDVNTQLWPMGFEVITENNGNFNGPLDG